MKIIQGRGNNRRTLIEVPHASIVKRSDDREIQQFSGLLCNIMGINNPRLRPPI